MADEPQDRTTLNLDALQALAHPLRQRILELLAGGDPATANGLARQLAESSGATSYHLRRLERFGFIEELDGYGKPRERWWRRTPKLFTAGAGTGDSPAHRAAFAQLRNSALERDARIMANYLDHETSYAAVWREAAVFHSSTLHATPDELHTLSLAVAELLRPLLRINAEDRPADARRVHATMHAVPWPNHESRP